MPETMKYDGRDIDTDRFPHPARRSREDSDRSARSALSARSIRSPAAPRKRPFAFSAFAGGTTTASLQKTRHKSATERLKKVPADLDLKPYRDEYDFDLVQRRWATSARRWSGRHQSAAHVKHQIERHLLPNLGLGRPSRNPAGQERSPSSEEENAAYTGKIPGQKWPRRSGLPFAAPISPGDTWKNAARVSISAKAAGSAPVIHTARRAFRARHRDRPARRVEMRDDLVEQHDGREARHLRDEARACAR